MLTDPTITEIAEKYNASSAQVVLSWHVARGVAVVPKSSNEQRQKENITVSYQARMSMCTFVNDLLLLAAQLGSRRCEADHRSGSQPASLQLCEQVRQGLGLDLRAVGLVSECRRHRAVLCRFVRLVRACSLKFTSCLSQYTGCRTHRVQYAVRRTVELLT